MYKLSQILLSWTEWTETNHKGWDMSKLKVDEAYLNVVNYEQTKHALYWRTTECINCLFKKLHEIGAAIPPPTTPAPTEAPVDPPPGFIADEPESEIKNVEDFQIEVSRKMEIMLYKWKETSEQSNQTKIFDKDESGFPKYLFPNHTENIIKLTNQPDFGSAGVYQLKINGTTSADFSTIRDPVNIYICEKFILKHSLTNLIII